MSIVTKKGDGGKTSLFFGGIVPKDHPRVELCGTLDELSSFLGISKSLIKDPGIKECLEAVQKDLLVIGAEVATAVKFVKILKKRIDEKNTKRLEDCICGLEAGRKRTFCFSVPGKTLVASCLDVARTIARRAERRAVSLAKRKLLKNREILAYLNRLSDLLYLLARKSETC
ncbi:MAG: cob(I)yrinic acid a,c-diamide adenosyltransferase [Candidatus Omnitrophota bacterium]